MDSVRISVEDSSPGEFGFQRFSPRVPCENPTVSVSPTAQVRRNLTDVEYAATMALIEWCRRVVRKPRRAFSPKVALLSSSARQGDETESHHSVASAASPSPVDGCVGDSKEGHAQEEYPPSSSSSFPTSINRLSEAQPKGGRISSPFRPSSPPSRSSSASPPVTLHLAMFDALALTKETPEERVMQPQVMRSMNDRAQPSSLLKGTSLTSPVHPLHRPDEEDEMAEGSSHASPSCETCSETGEKWIPLRTPLGGGSPMCATTAHAPSDAPLHRYGEAEGVQSSLLVPPQDALPARSGEGGGGDERFLFPSSASCSTVRLSLPVEATTFPLPPSHTVTEGQTLPTCLLPSSPLEAIPPSVSHDDWYFPFPVPPLVSPEDTQEMLDLLQQGADVWYAFTPPLQGGAYTSSTTLRASETLHHHPLAEGLLSPRTWKDGPSTCIPETVLHVLAKHGLVDSFAMCLSHSVHPILMAYTQPTDPIPIPFSLCEYVLSDPIATALFRLVVQRLENYPTTTSIDWMQPLGGYDFLSWLSSYQRLSQFWPLMQELPFFAAKRRKQERCVITVPVWRWDLEALIEAERCLENVSSSSFTEKRESEAGEDVEGPDAVRVGKERMTESTTTNAYGSEEGEGSGIQRMGRGEKKDVWTSRPEEASAACVRAVRNSHDKASSPPKKALDAAAVAAVMEASTKGVVVGGLEFRGEVIDAEKSTGDFVRIGQGEGWKLSKEIIQFYVQKGADIFFRSPFMDRSIIEELLLRNNLDGVLELLNSSQALDFNRILDHDTGNSLLHILAKERLFHTDVVCEVIKKILCRVNEKPYYDAIMWGKKNIKGEHFLSLSADTKRLSAFWKLVKGITYFIYVRKPIHISHVVAKEDWNALGDTARSMFTLDAGFQSSAPTASSSIQSILSSTSSQLAIKSEETPFARKKKLTNISSFSSFPVAGQKRMVSFPPFAQCSSEKKLGSSTSSAPDYAKKRPQMRNSSVGSSRRRRTPVSATKSASVEKEKKEQQTFSTSFRR